MMAKKGKLFKHGGSQAVRLPKECRFPEDEREVTVRREGRQLILEPVDAWTPELLDTGGSLPDLELPRPPTEPPRDPLQP